MHDLTAPNDVDTLAGLVELVDRFTIGDDWTVREDPTHDHRATLRWDRASIVLRDVGDLDLARFAALERARARKDLRRVVIEHVIALGLSPRTPYLRPAALPVNAGLTRCPLCGANVRAGTHRPGSQECDETRRERDHQLDT